MKQVPTFDATAYGPAFAEVLREERLAPLGPGSPHLPLRPRLQALTVSQAFAGQRVHDPEMAALCLAGVWLYHDFLDECHTICQDIGSTSGSYWHAIMHRREPDFWNSKYWFRRVGRHPIFATLREAAEAVSRDKATWDLGVSWDPFVFVDRCEAAVGQEADLLRQIQLVEWRLLFDFCYRAALQ